MPFWPQARTDYAQHTSLEKIEIEEAVINATVQRDKSFNTLLESTQVALDYVM
jgi:hypothetical protein